MTPAGRPQGRSAKKQKRSKGGSPRSLCRSGSPFVLLKPERGAPGLPLSLPMAQLRFQAARRDRAGGTGFVGSCSLVFSPAPLLLYTSRVPKERPLALNPGVIAAVSGGDGVGTVFSTLPRTRTRMFFKICACIFKRCMHAFVYTHSHMCTHLLK